MGRAAMVDTRVISGLRIMGNQPATRHKCLQFQDQEAPHDIRFRHDRRTLTSGMALRICVKRS